MLFEVKFYYANTAVTYVSHLKTFSSFYHVHICSTSLFIYVRTIHVFISVLLSIAYILHCSK